MSNKNLTSTAPLCYLKHLPHIRLPGSPPNQSFITYPTIVIEGTIKATNKRWFIILLLAHALRDPNFGDEFRMKWLTSNTITHLLCTHYDISFQDLKFNDKAFLDATELFQPHMGKLPSGHQRYPLLGLNLGYIYWGQKHFSE